MTDDIFVDQYIAAGKSIWIFTFIAQSGVCPAERADSGGIIYFMKTAIANLHTHLKRGTRIRKTCLFFIAQDPGQVLNIHQSGSAGGP